VKAIPTNPLAKHQRMIDALCADIRDRDATGFPRTDALRYLNSREAGDSNKAPASDHGNAA
jgi:hypothetical protein